MCVCIEFLIVMRPRLSDDEDPEKEIIYIVYNLVVVDWYKLLRILKYYDKNIKYITFRVHLYYTYNKRIEKFLNIIFTRVKYGIEKIKILKDNILKHLIL